MTAETSHEGDKEQHAAPARTAPRNRSERAGLQFPVGRIASKFRKHTSARLAGPAPVFTAGVMEAVLRIVCDAASVQAISSRKECRRVTQRHVLLALNSESMLREIGSDAHFVVPFAGSMPTDPSILAGSTRRKSPKAHAKADDESKADDEPKAAATKAAAAAKKKKQKQTHREGGAGGSGSSSIEADGSAGQEGQASQQQQRQDGGEEQEQDQVAAEDGEEGAAAADVRD